VIVNLARPGAHRRRGLGGERAHCPARQRHEGRGRARPPGQRLRHTPSLFRARRAGCPTRSRSPRNFLQILQRIWWRLDRALDEDTIRASALAGGNGGSPLRQTTNTCRPPRLAERESDGSLDVVENALSALGVRSVLCYETSDRDGPERATAGSPRTAAFWSACAGSSRRLPAGSSGRMRRSRSPTRRSRRAPSSARCTSTRLRTGPTAAPSRGLAALDALHEDTLLAHGAPPRRGELELVTRRRGDGRPSTARSNMEQRGRPSARLPAAARARHRRDRPSDMFEESRTAFLRLREGRHRRRR